MVDASSPTASGKPVTVPFTAALGPNTVVAVDIGGAGKTGQADLYVGVHLQFARPEPGNPGAQ